MTPATKPRSAADLEALGAFLARVEREGVSAEQVAAVAAHLAALAPGRMAGAAEQPWRELARLLKAPPDAPIPGRALDALRSWPASRIEALIRQVRALHAALERIENDRLEDEIREQIRHHYL